MYYEKPRYIRIAELEEKMYEAIVFYMKKNDRSPTVRELKNICKIPSTSTTLAYMQRLKNKGCIDWEPKKIRTIRITDTYIQKSS